MKKLSKLKVSILICIAVVMIVMGMSYTTKADILSEGTDEANIVELSLNDGLLKIYPTKYMIGASEFAYVGKYIITGSRSYFTPLQIINDSNKEVTFDITLKNASLNPGAYTTAIKIVAHGDTIINLHNEGNSDIKTTSNHPPIKLDSGTGNVTVNLDIISGSLHLELRDKSTVSGGYIYSEGITFNCKVPFHNTLENKVVLKQESNNGTCILDEENNVHIQKCINCGKDVIGQHNVPSVTSIDETYHQGKCSICLYDIKTKHNYGELKYNDGIYSKECTTNGCTEKNTLTFNLPHDGTKYTYGNLDNIIKATINNPDNIPYDEVKYKWYKVINNDGVDTYELMEEATDNCISLPSNTPVGEYRYRVETTIDGVVGSYETSIKVVPKTIEEDIVILPTNDNNYHQLPNNNEDEKVIKDTKDTTNSNNKANKDSNSTTDAKKLVDKTPDTSDEHALLQWLGIMIVSMLGMIIIKKYRRI